MALRAGARRSPSGMVPLSPERKWRAIAWATLVLAPAVWSLMIGIVALAADDDNGPATETAAALIAFGLCLIPFAFLVLAFASHHPRAPGAVATAMGLCLLVGILVSAMAADAVTGIVAGVGAGGIVALRRDPLEGWRARAWAVAAGSAYAFVLARVAGPAVLVAAPVFPFTGLGVADHLIEWRRSRSGTALDASDGHGTADPE